MAGFTLRPYQEDAVQKILESFEKKEKALMIMATGLGKTVIFAEVIKHILEKNGRSLVLAHREELINQAIDKIYRQAGYYPHKEKAEDYASRNAECIVGSVLTMQNERLESFQPDYFDLINVDEAHHAIAKSYQNILNYFTEYSLLGVTATPDRADQKELGNVFEKIVYSYTLPKAIKDKWLAPIKGKRVKDFEIDLSQLKVIAGDYQDKDLGEVISSMVGPIAYNIKEQTENNHTLIFCPNVESSKLMAETLSSLGLAAEYISGKHNADDRNLILNKFSRKTFTHLCSCNILLEGYDEPSVDAVVMLRPTTSRSLYTQAVGRGTRLYPGKEFLTLIEFTFNSDRLKLVEPYELFSDKGFEEAVRRRARSEENGDFIDYMANLEIAAQKKSSISDIMSRLTIRRYGFDEFDPFAIADLAGTDITGEFDLHYKGRKIEGPITSKQEDLLKRYGIRDFSDIDRAQASILISKFFENRWTPYIGEATPKQKLFLRKHGYSYRNITKALASILITTIKEQKTNGTFKLPEPEKREVIDTSWMIERKTI